MVALEGRFVLVAAARPPLFIKPPPDETSWKWTMTLKPNAEELALIAQEIGAELALDAPLGESDAAQAFWYFLLLNSGAS